MQSCVFRDRSVVLLAVEQLAQSGVELGLGEVLGLLGVLPEAEGVVEVG